MYGWSGHAIYATNLSQNLNRQCISLYDSLPFIFWPVLRKTIAKVPHQKVAKPSKSVFVFLQTGLFKTAWLPRDGFHTKQQNFILSSARPHRFFTTFQSHEALEAAHSITMTAYAMPFLYACAQSNFDL